MEIYSITNNYLEERTNSCLICDLYLCIVQILQSKLLKRFLVQKMRLRSNRKKPEMNLIDRVIFVLQNVLLNSFMQLMHLIAFRLVRIMISSRSYWSRFDQLIL